MTSVLRVRTKALARRTLARGRSAVVARFVKCGSQGGVPVTHLRKIMLEEPQRRHYSETTTRYYLRKVEAFTRHFQCSPDRLGPQHIREYQAYLFTNRKLSPGS